MNALEYIETDSIPNLGMKSKHTQDIYLKAIETMAFEIEGNLMATSLKRMHNY